MIDFQKNTLIILPHLDDEFALVPVIEKLAKGGASKVIFIYCSERISSTIELQKERRRNNLISLSTLGFNKPEIIYLNDFFIVEDNYLYKSAKAIREYLNNYINENNFNQILTLNFEGGHPDHDQLALIVNDIKATHKIDLYYFPAYNHRRNLFLPYSALKPLKKQEQYEIEEKLENFCWIKNIL